MDINIPEHYLLSVLPAANMWALQDLTALKL